MNAYAYLAIAIFAEVIATSALNASAGFSRPLPTGTAIVLYGVAFYCLSLALRTIPVGVAYAVWSGVGIVLVALIGVLWFRQSLDLPAIGGIGLILAGILILNLFSRATLP